MKYLIKTFGCRVNQAESFAFEQEFQEVGIRPTSNGEVAEVVVVNGCAVTHKAMKEVRQTLRAVRRDYPRAVLVLAGCPVNFQSLTEIKLPPVDLVVANGDKTKLVEKVLKCLDRKADLPLDWSETTFQANFSGPRALVKIQDGCNQFCTYCLVPYLRRQLISKKPFQVVEEIKELMVKRGTREAVLAGINLDRYQYNLTDLLVKILRETEIERICFGSINVGAFDDRLIPLYVQEFKKNGARTRLARHFHLPLQSGSTRILRRMGRPYKAKEYLDLVLRLKKEIPGVSVTTDLIIGFPGETEADFEASLAAIKKAGFLKVHLFRFSPREGTQAWDRIEEGRWKKVSDHLIKKRFRKARQVAERVGAKERKKLAEFPSWVLWEGEIKPGILTGYTDYFLKKEMSAPGADRPGSIKG